ncbi:MAG: diguanylate cyclase [Rhodoferax sp.]|uniref:sensor domain-containing diguanylate cyclase n=1 Tax=Rhodoferax sp. TaxID=50421 RepID=UPI00260FD663|nr:diguanylate cyclase [Rhodoferax sp.]MDD2882054.1 diguanylate cyclase [Rhodoferax sp.]
MSSSVQICAAIFASLPDAVFLIDPETSFILDCNEAALKQVGMPREEVLNHSVLTLQKDVVGIDQWASIAQAIWASDGFVFIGQHRHASGAEMPVEINTSHFVHDGKAYFLSIARNINQRLALEQDLSNRDAQLRFALTEGSDGIWDWNLRTDEVFFSPQLARMMGYGPHEMKPTLATWTDNIHPDDNQRVHSVLQAHIAGLRERYDAQYRLRNRNGHYLWVHDRGRVCEHDAQGRPSRVVGMVNNITDEKARELALLKIASHDALTGLLNRRECDTVLERQIQLCRRLQVPLGLCFFDLDHFKQINDTLGHAVGDRVLQHLCRVIEGEIRNTDYFFRWGGEEFLILCTDTPLADLLALAEKLRRRVELIDWSGIALIDRVTCCFGIAGMPAHGVDASSLFIAADAALYAAKANGRNRVEMAS